MVEAAPQAQPKTTRNAQKGFVHLQVLPGTFLTCSLSLRASRSPVRKGFFLVFFGGRFFDGFLVPLSVARG